MEGLNPKYVVSRQGNYFTISGTTDTDFSNAFTSGVLVSELPTGTYIARAHEPVTLRQNRVHVPEIYRVESRGDGYVNSSTVLRLITSSRHARSLTRQIQSSLEERTAKLAKK